jgi:citrate synthase
LLLIGQTYEFPIKNNTIDAGDLEKVRSPDGEVTRYYDPGYKNTVNCVSAPISLSI